MPDCILISSLRWTFLSSLKWVWVFFRLVSSFQTEVFMLQILVLVIFLKVSGLKSSSLLYHEWLISLIILELQRSSKILSIPENEIFSTSELNTFEYQSFRITPFECKRKETNPWLLRQENNISHTFSKTALGHWVKPFDLTQEKVVPQLSAARNLQVLWQVSENRGNQINRRSKYLLRSSTWVSPFQSSLKCLWNK